MCASSRSIDIILKRILLTGVLSAAIFFLIAAALIVSDPAVDKPFDDGRGLEFSSVMTTGPGALPEQQFYTARDGGRLAFRHYPSARPTARLLYLLHGSGWHGTQFDGLARRLAEAGIADVFVPDLRGHGARPERRGDVDYIGQFEDDLADLIVHTKNRPGARKIVLGGHSSGGGLVVRFAGGAHSGLVDGFVLLAPFLKYNAPTTRPNSGGWARPLTRRIIGLTMLNAVGIKWFNHLTVIQFNMPKAVLDGPLGDTATTAYSYRLNTGFAPRSDYQKDLRAIDRPLLVISGAADEAFVAEQFEPVISRQTDSGTYAVIEGENHLGVVGSPQSMRLIGDWLEARF